MLLHSLLRWASRWQVLAVCAALTVAFLLFFWSTEAQAPADTPGVIDLELAFSPARFDDIVESWIRAGVLEVQRRNLWIDLLFPFVYSFLLSGLLAALAAPSDARPGTYLSILLTLPFVAGLLDWLENGLLLFILGQGSARPPFLILVSSTVAAAKWVLLAVTAMAILVALARRVLQRTR
jgi:hypothetical protein